MYKHCVLQACCRCCIFLSSSSPLRSRDYILSCFQTIFYPASITSISTYIWIPCGYFRCRSPNFNTIRRSKKHGLRTINFITFFTIFIRIRTTRAFGDLRFYIMSGFNWLGTFDVQNYLWNYKINQPKYNQHLIMLTKRQKFKKTLSQVLGMHWAFAQT